MGVKFKVHYGDAPPLKFSVPKKWLEKPLTAVIEYYVEEYYNKKFEPKIGDAATVVAKDGAGKLIASSSIVSEVGSSTEDLFLVIAQPGDEPATASPAAPAAAPAPSSGGPTYTVTKEELEACFGVGAASRLLAYRRQRELEQNAPKKAKAEEKPKEDSMTELRGVMTAAATLMTGKGQTWNQALVKTVFARLDASPALSAYVKTHAAEARKKPSKGLTIESFQGSIKALATLKLDGDLSPLDAVCGLVTLLAPVEAVVKFRGADSLDILVLIQQKWNKWGPDLFAASTEGAELAPMVYKEIDRVASMCLKKFFQRNITDDQQEQEDKFVTVLARHMMKKAFNPKNMKSVALQMAEDALDDADQFETTSNGKELKKMFLDAGWGAEEKDLEDCVYFRCELNQGLAMYLHMNLVRLGRAVADQPNLVPQLVQALPQTTGGDPTGIFCGLACVLACAQLALADKKGAAVMLMLCPITQMWSQLAQHLRELDGVMSFVKLLDEAWVQASARYVEECAETVGVPAPEKGGEATDEQMTAVMVKSVNANLFDPKDDVVQAILGELPEFEGLESKALAAVMAAKDKYKSS